MQDQRSICECAHSDVPLAQLIIWTNASHFWKRIEQKTVVSVYSGIFSLRASARLPPLLTIYDATVWTADSASVRSAPGTGPGFSPLALFMTGTKQYCPDFRCRVLKTSPDGTMESHIRTRRSPDVDFGSCRVRWTLASVSRRPEMSERRRT